MENKEKEIISRKHAKELGFKHYYTGKPCKNGHLDFRHVSGGACAECARIVSRQRSLSYYKEHREDIRASFKKKYHENVEYYRERSRKSTDKEKARERARKWREKNTEKHRAYSSEWRKKNPEKRYEYEKNRCENDSLYMVMQSIRKTVLCSFSRGGYTKRSRTHDILGCSYEDFKIHIEKQFQKGMTWENRGKWHFDHIVPISSAKNIEDVIALNHFTNLRPLWAEDNLKKSDKMEYLL